MLTSSVQVSQFLTLVLQQCFQEMEEQMIWPKDKNFKKNLPRDSGERKDTNICFICHNQLQICGTF